MTETDLDVRLIRRARQGDLAAMDRLTERFAAVPRIVRLCNHRLGRPIAEHELGDVIQNVFVALWGKLDDYRGDGALEAWFYGFCLREVWKARKSRRRAERLKYDDVGEPFECDAPPSVESARIEVEVDALGPPASEIVRRKHFDDRSFPGIAAELDLPLGTVKTYYYRAIRRLQVSLGPLWRARQ